MNNGIKTVIYPVSNLEKAKAIYNTLLGAAPYADSPYYVGWKLGSIDIGLDPNGHQAGLTSPVTYYHVDDIGASVKALLDAGAQLLQAARDVGGGRQIATLKDADGNIIGVLQDA
jgi:predicted enzyme related to lactoylglutathione lyase